jgi:hypothetical protein
MRRRKEKYSVAAHHPLRTLCLGLALTTAAATPSFATKLRGYVSQDMTYAGRCGLFLLSPNGQRIFYRYDLRRWSYGDERDFSCFVLDN